MCEHTLVPMAANGITLKPVRMGDLVASESSAIGTDAVTLSKYVPPSKRQNGGKETGSGHLEQQSKIDMGEENFPTLGSTPKKTVVWGKNAAKSSSTEPRVAEAKAIEPKAIGPNLSDKIKEKIRLDAIAEEERVRGGETDVWKMTPAQLEAEGWVCLPLKSSKNVSY